MKAPREQANRRNAMTQICLVLQRFLSSRLNKIENVSMNFCLFWVSILVGDELFLYFCFYDFEKRRLITWIWFIDNKSINTNTENMTVCFQHAYHNRIYPNLAAYPKRRKSGRQNVNHHLTISSDFLFFENEIISFHTKAIESSWLCQILGNNLLWRGIETPVF